MRTLFITTVLSVALPAVNIFAADNNNLLYIEITPLLRSKDEIPSDIGSSKYSFRQQSLANLPSGEFTPLNDVLLQAPGVAQDSYGQVHIRGDHDGLQYRLNDIILPEGISGFGQTLDTHIASKIDLITGALPAEYGYRTAGMVNITTPTGSSENGGTSSIRVGSNNTVEANQEFYGSKGKLSYFLSGTYLENNRGLEPPTDSSTSIHNDTTQDKQFAYLSYAPDPDHKLSAVFGNSTNRFEIPNNPNQPQNFTLNGVPDFNSASLNERQFEHNTYGIFALQGRMNDETDYQIAYFIRASDVLFKPDKNGDLIFNGIAARDERKNLTNGLQNDFKYVANDAHTLKAGWNASYEQAQTNTSSFVFPCCDVNGLQTSNRLNRHVGDTRVKSGGCLL